MSRWIGILVVAWFAALAGCGTESDAGAGGNAGAGAGAGGAGTSSGGGGSQACEGVDLQTNPKNCGSCGHACGGDEVCTAGACNALPKTCPCPVESYCDLASNMCVIGCLDDAGCSAGRICDAGKKACREGCREDPACGAGKICENTLCQVGCRKDAECGSGMICEGKLCQVGCRKDQDCTNGEICETLKCRKGCKLDADCGGGNQVCDPKSLTCHDGCTNSSQCGPDTICDTAAKQCVAGCVGDATCSMGKVCLGGMCTPGCKSNAGCASGTHCDVGTHQCVPGCEGDPALCAMGEACVSYQDGTYACGASCYGFECNDINKYDCLVVDQKYNTAKCRLKCSSDSDCPAGQECTPFTSDTQVPGQYSEQLCAKPCAMAGCNNTVDGYGDPGGCGCGADGVCHMDNGASQYICYQIDPSYGL